MDAAIARFHQEREIFKETGVHDDFSLPCQHSLCYGRLAVVSNVDDGGFILNAK
jgi:hypothetical protein